MHIDETLTWRKVKDVVQELPDRDAEALPGVKWGYCMQLYTPAFWKLQYALHASVDKPNAHRLCTSVVEEVVMCLLGGFGIPSEIGIMAFERLKAMSLIFPGVSQGELLGALSTPMRSRNGKPVVYRFYNQKSKYLHEFLSRLDLHCIPEKDDLALRNWLLTVNGIGFKTASWVTRNWMSSDKVAILDIHLLRAGQLTGFFERPLSSAFDYLTLEEKYLLFCSAIDVRPSHLDAVIWRYMKKNTKLALQHLFS